MMLTRIICALILVVLLPVSGLCAKEFNWRASQYRGEWFVYGSTVGKSDFCAIVTSIPAKPEPTWVTIAMRVSDYNKGDSPELFVKITSPSVDLMVLGNEKATMIANYTNKPKSIHNLYFEKFQNNNYVSGNLDPNIFLPVFAEAMDMTLVFPNGQYLVLSLEGTSDAVHKDMIECGRAYGRYSR